MTTASFNEQRQAIRDLGIKYHDDGLCKIKGKTYAYYKADRLTKLHYEQLVERFGKRVNVAKVPSKFGPNGETNLILFLQSK